jgi:drug/metabolite transporter (DMT)-like permease
MALVGSYVALSKPLVAAIPVFLLAWLRFGIGTVAMLGWLRKPADELPQSLRTKWLLFLESFLGNFLFSICMLYGVSMTSAVSAGVVMAAIPAAVALMSWLFLKERVGLRTWGAIALAVLGIALVSLSKTEHTMTISSRHLAEKPQNTALLGHLLLCAAVLCEAAYAVIGKTLSKTISPKRISALINLWGLALATPLGIYTALSFDFVAVPMGIWPLLLFYSVAACVWTVWLWMTGLQSVPAARAGVFTVMLPISAAAVGVLFLGERLSEMQLLAFGIAVLGVVMATVPSKASR